MDHSLAQFQKKLSAIGPYKQIESPPSSNQKPIPKQQDQRQSPPYDFKLPDLSELASQLSSPLPLHKTQSEHLPVLSNDYQLEEVSSANNHKINSIYSTIDILFNKIQKIKEEFSYALPSPSQTTLSHYKAVGSSQKRQEQIETNKENTTEDLPYITSQFQHKNNTHKKVLEHSNSLPLQQHQTNISLAKHCSEANETYVGVRHHHHSNNFKISDFHLGKCMGSGKFGDVYFCVHKETGFVCAIKKIFKSTIKEYNMEEQLTTELKIHYFLSHPNIIKLYAHFDDQYHIFLMMEYATEDTLMKQLSASEETVSQYIQQTVDAVQEMHKNKVIHRDIKPQNIVLTFGIVKLCDFGWASIIDNSMKHSFCGTLDYVSPQMKDVGEYNQSVDLWSIGVLTFQLLAGFPPYKHQITHWKLKGSKRKIRWNWEVLYPPDFSHASQMFIEGLLKQNPTERLSLQGCQNSAFFMNYREYPEDYLQEDCLLLLN